MKILNTKLSFSQVLSGGTNDKRDGTTIKIPACYDRGIPPFKIEGWGTLGPARALHMRNVNVPNDVFEVDDDTNRNERKKYKPDDLQ
jgi:hypothetical protein